jgi:hypothetical protein
MFKRHQKLRGPDFRHNYLRQTYNLRLLRQLASSEISPR